ncbi:AAA family ATPase [Nonomuraea sp. LP-02]|uniref:AAA family ATPase n=1 Tax=Nonomuraea sp. LP-02 TaxID=3097960 RepID=UPI002E33310D|nr:AAA family ATPase [Nonomuraea sp. LP-02]MED7922987.1 AAA family ATPase [Nonomuraea sp. LP-02]
MRPHRLTLTAFGSFPGTETVDFDALAEAGLFLIHGPMGAGKTTILDALCFALYGQVPGQRNSARSLRCDHAPAGTGPSVTLEATIRGRLLRVQRSPAWLRPKLRGSGVTEEKSKVIVSERRDGAWHGLTTRLDEAGDLVGGLLGMNAEQFWQVAMLPQGDFAKFLRADGEERGKLLERLFTVKVFTAAEGWLAEQRKLAWREAQELRRQVDFAVQRVEEATLDPLIPLPAAPAAPGQGEEAPSRDDDPLRWAGALLAAAQAVAVRAEEEHEAAARALREARLRFDQAAALADRQRRHADALTARRALDERADERADLQAVLDDAARADRVIPLVTAVRQREETAAKARALATDALARAHPLLPSASLSSVSLSSVSLPSADELAALERDRRAEIARLSELLTEEARLSGVRRDLLRVEEELTRLVAEDERVAARLAALPALIEQAEAELARCRADATRIPAAEAVRDAATDLIGIDRELAGLAAELETLERREAEASAAEAELPARLAEASAALEEVRAQAAAVPAASAGLDAARAALEAVRRRDALAAELETVTAAHQVLVDRAQALRERWLDLRQARMDGMAAELARDLADGRPCAVCGSEHHPHPASPAPSAPSADDERAAEDAHENALAEREASERHLASLGSRHADAVEATGDLDPETAAAVVRQAEEELSRLRAVAGREAALAAALERVEAERERVRDQAARVAEELAAHHAHRTRLEADRTRLRTRLEADYIRLRTRLETDHTRLRTHLAAPTTRTPEVAACTSEAAAGTPEIAAGTPLTPDATSPDAAVSGPAAPDHGALHTVVAVLAEVERELGRLRRAAELEGGAAREVARRREESREQEERARALAARLAAGRARHEELSADAARLAARLDAARGGDATLTDRLSRLTDEAELLREAVEATSAALAADDELARARNQAREAAAEAGFADVPEAEAAYRGPTERERKAEALRRLDDEHAAVTAALADPELAAAAAEPAPDLAGAAAAREAAEQAHTSLASVRDRAASRARRLAELEAELSACVERWRPAEERHRLAERMAALTGGTSGDNRWSMSLSSYVLGERLRAVVEAANERLDHMSAGRYLLQHDLRKTAGSRGRSGGGLGLRVSDGWTGVDRDPATLSGGESFITSLALALGLADVVTAEAGGAEIGALFVDEGFGTLDEDTLDGVLDILDGLRDGGRAVGIVSHVAELRSRITAQLKVTKTRRGSALATSGVG